MCFCLNDIQSCFQRVGWNASSQLFHISYDYVQWNSIIQMTVTFCINRFITFCILNNPLIPLIPTNNSNKELICVHFPLLTAQYNVINQELNLENSDWHHQESSVYFQDFNLKCLESFPSWGHSCSSHYEPSLKIDRPQHEQNMCLSLSSVLQNCSQ